MARKILAVVAGYITMFLIIFISFTVLYLILGVDGAFEPGSYRVTTVWTVLSIVLGLIAAVIGGYVCTLISRDSRTAMYLAALVLILGIIMALPSLGKYDASAERTRDADNMEAMQNAAQPDLMLILNPIIGAAGVILGSRMKKEKNIPQPKTAVS